MKSATMAGMEITIDNDGLSKIYAAGQSVTLARAVGHVVESDVAKASAAVAVAWQAFAPLQTNMVSWTDEYYCFATTAWLVLGAVITMNSEYPTPMQLGSIYEFTKGQFVPQPRSTGSSYVIGNATSSGSYTFGIAQTATVNNVQTLAPLCAFPVLYNEAVYLNPTELIAIFLSSATKAGTIIPPPVNAFSIVVSSGATSGPTIGFNDETDTFYQIA